MLQDAMQVMHPFNVQHQSSVKSTAAQSADISCLDAGM